MTRLTLSQIYDLTHAALMRCGASNVQAGPTAVSIRDAEAEGIRNVGLGYLPLYLDHLRCGKVIGSAQPTLVRHEGGIIQVDAAHGFCHPAFILAFDLFVARTRELGISALGIHRSYSAGVVGWFNDLLAREGLVSLAFANAPSSVAPFGGKRPFFGTNPLGFGVPRAQGDPIILDMATSGTARVNVLQAAIEGRDIPLGWANDADGNPTTNAKVGLAGSLAPLGGAKGFGLGLMVDILAAGLTGSHWSYQASPFGNNEGGPPAVGQLFIALDPAQTGGSHFTDQLEAWVHELLAQEGVRLPGSSRHHHRAHAEAHGVEVPDELIAQIEAY